jgi:hypothetical protein
MQKKNKTCSGSKPSMFSDYLKKMVVIDTFGPLIYLGVLQRVEDTWIQLGMTDVHDTSDSSTTKENYIRKSAQTGIKNNRKSCRLEQKHIVSISLLSEIETF